MGGTTHEETAPASGRWRRVLRRLGLVSAGGIVVVGLLWLGRATLLAPPLTWLAAQQVRDRFGAALSIGAIEGDWLEHLRLCDVRLEPDAGAVPVVRRLSVPSVDVRWRLLDLVRGRLDALTSIGLHAERIELDLTEPTSGEPSATVFEWPPLPAIDVTIGELDVALPGERRLRLTDVALDHGMLAEHAVGLVATAVYDDPEIGRREVSIVLDGDWREAVLSLASVELDESRLGPVSIAEGRVDLSEVGRGRVQAHVPIALGAEGATQLTTDLTIGRGTLTIATVGEAVDLAVLEALEGLVPPLPLSGVVDEVDARVELRADEPVTVMGFVRAHDVVWDGFGVDRLSSHVVYSGATLELDETRIERGGDRLIGGGVTLPLEADGLAPWLAAVRGRIAVHSADARAFWPDERVSLGGEPVQARVQTTWTAEGIAIDSGELTTKQGKAELERGRLRWASPLASSELDLELRVDLPDLSELGIEDVAGSCRGLVRLAGPIDGLNGEANLEAEIAWADLEEGTVTIDAEFDGERALIERLDVSGERVDLAVSGAVGFDGELDDLEVRGEVRELEHFGAAVDAGRVLVDGRFDGTVRAPTGPFTLSCSELGGLAGIGEEFDTVDVRGRLFASSLSIERCDVSSEHGSIAATGDVRWDESRQDVEALVTTLVARDGGAELVLKEPARLAFTRDTTRVGPLTLEGAGGRAELEYARTPSQHEARLVFESFDLFALLGPLVPEGFAVEGIDGLVTATFDGPPSVEGDLVVTGLRSPGDESSGWALELDTQLREGSLDLRSVDARHPRWGHFTLTGSAPFDPGGAELLPDGPVRLTLDAGELDVGAAGRLIADTRLSGVWTGRADLNGRWRELVGSVVLATEEAQLTSDEPGGASFGPGSIDVELTLTADRTSGRVSLEGFEDVTLSGNGSVASGLDVPGLLANPRAWLSADLAGQVDFELGSLSRVATWIESLPSCDGRVHARGRLGGTLADPEFLGQVQWADGRLRAAAELPPLEALNGYLTFSADRVELKGLEGELGAAPFALTGSVERSPDGPVCDLKLSGENLLLQRRRGFKVRADTTLNVAGPLDRLVVTGRIALTNGRFTKSFDPFSVLDPRGGRGQHARSSLDFMLTSDPLFGSTKLDIEVTTREAFVVKNNVVKGGVRPDLRLLGTAEVPYFVGRIYLDPTRVTLPAGRLEVRSGTVSFLRSTPFRPELELVAEAFVRGYRIDVRIDGSLEEPEITLSSTPPLASEDALVLIVTGQLPANVASTEAVQTVALFLAQDFVQRWLASESTEDTETFLDRIDVWTGVDPIKTGVETYNISLRMAGDPEKRGLVQLIRGEQDAYEHYNFGYRFLFRLR